MKHMNQPTLFCHPMNSLGKDVILKLKRTKKTQQTTKQQKRGNILKLLKESKCNLRFYKLYGRMATAEGSEHIWAFLHVLPTYTQCKESFAQNLYFQ